MEFKENIKYRKKIRSSRKMSMQKYKILSQKKESSLSWVGFFEAYQAEAVKCPVKGMKKLKEKHGETFGISVFFKSKKNIITSDPELMGKIYRNHQSFTREEAYAPLSETAIPLFDREQFSRQIRKELVKYYMRAFQVVKTFQDRKTDLSAAEKEKLEDAQSVCEDFYESTIVFFDQELLRKIDQRRPIGDAIEIKPLLIQATGKAALSLFFGRRVMEESQALLDLDSLIQQTVDIADRSSDYMKSIQKLLPKPISCMHRTLSENFKSYREEIGDVFERLIEEILNEERAPDRRKSVLEEILEKTLGREWKKNYNSWSDIEDKEKGLLIDTLQGIIFASADTTASAMNLLIYAVIRYGYQDRIYDELADIDMENMNYKDYEKVLSICDKYVNEAMRVYPSVPVVLRRAVKDMELTHKGCVTSLNKGDLIVHSMFVQHRDDGRFEDAEMFNPDRLDADTKYDKGRGRQMNFGDGIHSCVGRYIAISESALGLALLVKSYRMELEDDSWDIELDMTSTLKTTHPIKIKFIKRES